MGNPAPQATVPCRGAAGRRHRCDGCDAGGTTAYKAALQFGLTDVAELLGQHGGGGPMSEDELFVAACASADEEGADAAMLMVALGWPVAVRGADWDASALNLAVFRGDATLTRFLLGQGARWTEELGYGDNVCGTLS